MEKETGVSEKACAHRQPTRLVKRRGARGDDVEICRSGRNEARVRINTQSSDLFGVEVEKSFHKLVIGALLLPTSDLTV